MALGAMTAYEEPMSLGAVAGPPSIGRGDDDQAGTSWDQVARHCNKPIFSGKHNFILIQHITKIQKIIILPSVFRRLLFFLPNFLVVLPTVVEGT